MNISRRGALKVAALGAAAATGVRKAEARERLVPPEDATGMLYDSTLCIGCKACVVACRDANELSLERDSTLYDDAVDLTGHTANIIKLYNGEEGHAFVKQQCMHCVDPACASAVRAPVAAAAPRAATFSAPLREMFMVSPPLPRRPPPYSRPPSWKPSRRLQSHRLRPRRQRQSPSG